MSKISRRRLLEAAAAGGVLGACTQKKKADPFSLALRKPEVPGTKGLPKGQESWVTSVCGQCFAGCGINVRVVEGRAVKIEGTQAFPVNLGTLGPKGQAGLEMLYHRDRLKGPLKREGARGEGRWKSVTWDEALAEIGQALRELRASGQSRSVVLLDGEPRGPMRELWERFLQAYGSPNHINHRAITDGGKVLAMQYMHGALDLPAYDWDSTRYVLGFGAALLESWCQTIHVMRAASKLRHSLPGRRVKFVQLSPRYSTTASEADEWIPIEPATYGALALGLAHILVKKELYDAAFVKAHTFGFEPWVDAGGRRHRGFRELVLEDYPPDKVAAITRVPLETIERIALEMAEFRPAIALADGGAAAATNGLGTAMAIHALNALLGNLERPGGLLVQKRPPFSPWKPVELDEVAKAGLAAPRVDGVGSAVCPLGGGFVQHVPEAVLSGEPYPVKALLLHRSNPVFSKPDGRKWIEAMAKVPLVVSFSPLPDESTLWADWVLPDHTYLERWELVEPAPGSGRAVVGLRQPVVAPQLGTMQTGEALLRLAKAVGGPVAAAFGWDDFRGALTERLQGLLNQEQSNVAAEDAEGLLEGMVETSGWWNKDYAFEAWDSAFPTPSGKFEFYSQALAAKLAAAFPSPEVLEKELAARGVVTRGDDLCMPHWEPPRFSGSPEEYPFLMVPYRGINYAAGGVRHQRRLVELPLAPGINPWHERIELNPGDARALGVGNGDRVVVETTVGQRELHVLIHAGIRPGTVALPLGYGSWPPKPDDPPGGYRLLANLSDPLAGIFAAQCTRARIRRVS